MQVVSAHGGLCCRRPSCVAEAVLQDSVLSGAHFRAHPLGL